MKSYAIYRFIIKPVGMSLLLNIDNNMVKELASITGMTSGHINIILLEMEKEKLIERSYKKRHIGNNVRPYVYTYDRTEKGNELCKHLREIKKIIERD
ncbi:MAG: hypothetical protein KAK00_00400 [Nanoarchaeota archaeon]|nr:hypothetical protein [Nanoarchaeota archaeon]